MKAPGRYMNEVIGEDNNEDIGQDYGLAKPKTKYKMHYKEDGYGPEEFEKAYGRKLKVEELEKGYGGETKEEQIKTTKLASKSKNTKTKYKFSYKEEGLGPEEFLKTYGGQK